MPLPPPRPSEWPPARVTMESPREAALRAIVYRNQLREKPRERGLRVLGLLGTLLVHLVFLFGAILGPAYEPDALPSEPLGVLQVRLLDNKPQPPPPPPVRGTPPKRHGPVHRGHAAQATPARRADAASRHAMTAPSMQPLPDVPAPPLDRPVIATKALPSAPLPSIVAAPLPPVSVPKPVPAAAPQLQSIAVSPPPPAVTLEAPKAAVPVPPRFQPEPVRKAQAEGTRPMPPPASLAMPAVPAQSAPSIQPPAIAMAQAAPTPVVPSRVSALTHAVQAAAPPAPELEAVPLSAPAAPTVNLRSSLQAPSPVVAREQPRVQAPTIRVAAAELAAVPLPPTEAAPATPRVQAPAVDLQPAPVPAAELAIQPPVARVEAAPLPAPAEQPSAHPSAQAPAAPAQQVAAATDAAAASAVATTPSTSAADAASASDVSSAPDATAQGRDDAAPGQLRGSTQPAPSSSSQRAGEPASSHAGQGQVAGASGQGLAGSPDGTYIQLLPRGDTKVMQHRTTGIHYKATRFDPYWTPEGESSIDTALRHVVEKTTVSHTFHLPRGVRIKCVGMPLLPVLLLGCGNPDPPAAPVDAATYRKLNLPTLNGSIPKVAPPASTPAPARPVTLTGGAQCAAARVAGGPLPPGCDAGLAPLRPAAQPARSSSSWVPASDQFH